MMFDSPASYLDEPVRVASAASLLARTADALDLYNAAEGGALVHPWAALRRPSRAVWRGG